MSDFVDAMLIEADRQMRAEWKRLDELCKQALLLQDPDRLSRLQLVTFPPMTGLKAGVASSLCEQARIIGDELVYWLEQP